MAVDPTQLIADANCIFSCVPQGMIQAAQLAQMIQPSIVTTTLVTEAGTNTPVLLLAANPKRRRAIIQNIGTQIFIGPSTVTGTTGLLMAAGPNNPTSRLEVFTQGELYVAGTAGQTVVVIEFLVP